MAYARTWDSTTPQGTAQISLGDDAIRALKEDLQARLLTLVTDLDLDPLVLKPTVVGSIGSKTKQLVIPPEAFVPTEDDDDITYFDTYVQSDNSGDREMKAPVILPPGVIITEIEFVWNRQSMTGIVGELFGVGFDTGVSLGAAIASISTTAAGPQLTSTGTISHEVSADRVYKIRIKPSEVLTLSRIVIYGVRITYECGDASETL